MLCDLPYGDEYHGKDEIFSQQRYNQRRGRYNFHHEEEEHVERDEN